MPFFSRFSRALALTLLIVVPLRAQSLSAAAANAPLQLDPLTVQGRETDLIASAGASSQGLVGIRELQARPWSRRGELLEVIPGVVITQHSGGGKANQYFLRGFNLDHGTDFSLGVDGLPVNLRTHAHGQGYADLNFLIPELVRQVEYRKGPFDASTGDFSSAGSAEFRLFDALPQGLVRLEYGENNFARALAAETIRDRRGTTTFAAEFSHDDGPWRLPENFNRLNGFLRRHWTAADRDYRLTAMAYHGRWRSTDQIPLRAVDSGTLDRFDAIDPTAGGETERASLAFDATLRTADTATYFNTYAILYRLNLFSNFTYFLDDPIDGDQFNQRDARLILGGALTHTRATPRGETTFGLQVRNDLIDELGLHRTTRRARVSTIRDDNVDEASAGVFAKNSTRWNSWLRTEAGLRADIYRFDVDSDNSLNSGTRRASIASPKLAMIFGPWSDTEFYANVGTGFHSNDARGTTIRVDPVSRAPTDRVAPLVRSRGAEIGVRTSFLPGLVSTVSAWTLDLDSELVFVGDAGGTEASDASRRHGVEFANHYRANSWLTLDADIAFTRARYRDVGPADRVANSISRVVTAGVTAQTKAGWFGTVRLRYFGPQPLIEDNSVQAPSSLTCNARIGWANARWEVSLEAFNLFDRKNHDIAYAYASRLPGEPAAGLDDIHFHPAEPLTFRASVTLRF